MIVCSFYLIKFGQHETVIYMKPFRPPFFKYKDIMKF